MGLRYERALIQSLLQGVVTMKESVTYQAILEEGEARGEAKGRAEGEAKEARKILLLLGRDQLGEGDPWTTFKRYHVRVRNCGCVGEDHSEGACKSSRRCSMALALLTCISWPCHMAAAVVFSSLLSTATFYGTPSACGATTPRQKGA
jgi:hypothetical protein